VEADDRADARAVPSHGALGSRVDADDPMPAGAGLDDEDRSLPPFLTPREAATRLRVSVWAVYDAVKAGTLPAVRVGRAIRIPRHAVVTEAPARLPAGA
jgi:excisionase family DNA binding protein